MVFYIYIWVVCGNKLAYVIIWFNGENKQNFASVHLVSRKITVLSIRFRGNDDASVARALRNGRLTAGICPVKVCAC